MGNNNRLKKITSETGQLILREENIPPSTSLPSQKETVIWEGHPSQILNLTIFITCGLTCWLVIPIFIAIYAWLEIRARKYVLTNERLRIISGVFTKRIDDTELYRVKDTTFIQPLIMRIFSLGNIEVETSDPATPFVMIEAIPKALGVRELFRKVVEMTRDRKGVKEVDHYSHLHKPLF